MTATNIFADLSNRLLVASSKASAEKRIDQPARPGHTDKLYWAVQPMKVTAVPTNEQPFELLDGGLYAITVSILKYSDGSVLAGPTTLADTDGYRRVGKVDLNTAAMITAISSARELACILEVTFDDGTNDKTTIQQDFYVKRNWYAAGTPTELPLTSYPTWDEAKAVFLKKVNDAGVTGTFVSPDGTKLRIVGVDNDGAATDAS